MSRFAAVPGADRIQLVDDLDVVLRTVDSVQVARIHPGYIQAHMPTPASNLEFDVAGGDCLVDTASPEFDAEVGGRLSEILLDKRSYFDRAHGELLLASHLFKPQVAFRVRAGDDRAMFFYDPENDLLCGIESRTLDSGIYGNLGDYGYDVSPARKQLISLVKELLSSDPEIQALQVERLSPACQEGAGSSQDR